MFIKRHYAFVLHREMVFEKIVQHISRLTYYNIYLLLINNFALFCLLLRLMEIFGFFNVYTYQQLMVDQYDSLTERTRNCFRKCIFNLYLELKKNLIRSGSLKQ